MWDWKTRRLDKKNQGAFTKRSKTKRSIQGSEQIGGEEKEKIWDGKFQIKKRTGEKAQRV